MYFMAEAQQYNEVMAGIPDNASNENDLEIIKRNLQLINIWIDKIKAAALAAQNEGERVAREVPPNCRPYFSNINQKIGTLIANINAGPEILPVEERPSNLIPLVGGRTRQSGGYLYPTSSSRKSKKSSRNRKKRKNKKSRR
jgi:hypothetical protein